MLSPPRLDCSSSQAMSTKVSSHHLQIYRCGAGYRNSFAALLGRSVSTAAPPLADSVADPNESFLR